MAAGARPHPRLRMSASRYSRSIRSLRSIGVLHPDERGGAGHGNHDAPEIDPLDVGDRVRVGQPAGLPHQTDDDFVRDAHDDVVPDIAIRHVSPGVSARTASPRFTRAMFSGPSSTSRSMSLVNLVAP
jgi:hypothetical protein